MADPTVDLRTDGVLWMINKTIFHPRGYALAINTLNGELTLMGDGTEPWKYASDLDNEKFVAFNNLLTRANHQETP